jgi:spore germination protein
MTRRSRIGVGAIVVVAAVALVATFAASSGPRTPATPPAASPTMDPSPTDAAGATVGPTATPRPAPGHEVFGFVPYWEMRAGVAEHLATTDLTTLALFSVTHARSGAIDTSQNGYKRITGALGAQLIGEAHGRGVAVQIVYSSFGTAQNARLLGSPSIESAAIDGLVKLAARLGVDGIDVDIEQLDAALVPAYGDFVGHLRTALRATIADGQVSVATTSGVTGAAMALAAVEAGADRVFLMGYDYHFAGSEPGASAPIDRRDGAQEDLPWSLDLYESVGVPVEKTILGLPLYGMRWRVVGPWLGAERIGNGAIWIPSENLGFLANPPVPPELDDVEQVEFYSVPPPAAPSSSRGPSASPDVDWQAIYVDSPTTLTPKLALADARGLAGAGFWAIGYERGQPDVTALIARFRSGKLQ